MSIIRPSPVTSGFSRTAAWTYRPNFMESPYPPYLHTICFLALLDFVSRQLLSRRRRPSSVHRPYTQVSQKPLHGSRPNLWIAPSPPNLQSIFIFKIFNFQICSDFFFHGTIWEQNCQTPTPPSVFILSGPNFTNFMINTAVIGEYKVMDILAISAKN